MNSDSSALGILELSDRGAGYVRRRQFSYLPEAGDYYVPPRLVNQFGLRTGDELAGVVGRSPGRGKAPPVERILAVNGRPPEEIRHRPAFASLGAIHPNEPLWLDCGLRRYGQPDFTNRIIDLLCPFGKGQRALIVAPAKAGKTMVLQAVAEGLAKNYPEGLLMILLVDERPEEVTEMELCGYGEVVASSFDCPAERHVAVAELTLERARRRVEQGEDVFLILDSITRLARAYNTVERGTGRTLTGGLDSSALEKPKRFLGSARKIDPARGGGSLTIIGTALIDTGSKMDQVIYEEFKGTGNSELTLSRELAERRIFPAIDLHQTGTRREELLLPPDLLAASQTLRARLAQMTPVDAMSYVISLMRRAATNAEIGRLL
ncbi:MAG TPA: transcription termination factor Rho [Gemmatimonadales bacterium]|nr:transcription termination factor Rho [Gemmatimonadales bacterium]